MVRSIFSIKGSDLKEVMIKVGSIMTISVGSWIIFDKVRTWMESMAIYKEYSLLLAILLLFLGLVILDFDGNGGGR